MSRILQVLYEKFSFLMSGYCKSAGTLVVLGCTELIFTLDGELGPLDVQMAKKDELLESQSGLTVMAALTALNDKALLAFELFFTSILRKGRGRITSRTASNIAATLTSSLYAPIYSQIDPMHVGEAGRAMTIGADYARRLIEGTGNFEPSMIDQLVAGYSSHSFVIDAPECLSLFANSRPATYDEFLLLGLLGGVAREPEQNAIVRYLNSELVEPDDEADGDDDADEALRALPKPDETDADEDDEGQ